MKRLCGVAAFGLLIASLAYAQTTFTIVPEHQTIIRQYVNREGQTVTVTQPAAVGAVVPGDIALTPFPETVYTQVPEIQKYDFVRWGDKVVVVDPQTRMVVAVIN